MSQRLNLLSPEFRANPYPYYAQLRRESPVCQADPNGLWIITRYDDIITAFKTPQVFASAGLRYAFEPAWLKRRNPMAESLPVMDPPKHGRMRALVNGAFNQTLIGRMESYARDVASRLAEGLLVKGKVEFVSDFALQLPANLMAMVLGVDPAFHVKFKAWSDEVGVLPTIAPDDTARQDLARKNIDEMTEYLRNLVVERRKKPMSDDLISELMQARVEGEALSDEEMMDFLCVLLVAGLETTTFLISHAVMILAQHPEWMERLRDNEVRINHFIEEVLRCEPPVHSTMRVTTTDTELGGARIPAGSPVLLAMASGLRDESQYPNPEVFDPERGVQANLGFGHGIHFCLGAPLGRMEARVALDTLLSMCSRFELLTDKLEWNTQLTGRSILSLPLHVHPL
jgi:cytochrome P450